MPGMLIPAIAAGVTSLASGAANFFSNRKANKTNMQLAAQQRAHELNLWHMQNAYNTPEMQRKRLESAGLNPMLMYSGNLQNAAGDIGSGIAARVESNRAGEVLQNVLPVLSLYNDMRLKAAQSNKLDEEAKTVALQRDIDVEQRDINLSLLRQKFNLNNKYYDIKDRYLKNDIARLGMSFGQMQFNNSITLQRYRLDAMRFRLQQRNLELNMQLAVNQDKREDYKLREQMKMNNAQLRVIEKKLDKYDLDYSDSLENYHFRRWNNDRVVNEYSKGLHPDANNIIKGVYGMQHGAQVFRKKLKSKIKSFFN